MGRAADPIPLRDADGVVRAWACGHCRQVKTPWSRTVPFTDEDVARFADDSREGAQRCCACERCRVSLARRFDEPESIEPVADLSWEASRYCGECWNGTVREETITDRQRWADEVRNRGAAREATLARAVDRNAALLLEREMSRISEEHYCAGWLVGLGGILWAMTQDRASRMLGFGEVPNEELDVLVELSARAGGWWRYDTFVPIAEWLADPREERPAAPSYGDLADLLGTDEP